MPEDVAVRPAVQPKSPKVLYAARQLCVCGEKLATLDDKQTVACLHILYDSPHKTTSCQSYTREAGGKDYVPSDYKQVPGALVEPPKKILFEGDPIIAYKLKQEHRISRGQ